MTSPDRSGITVSTRSYTTPWDTIVLADPAETGIGVETAQDGVFQHRMLLG